LKLLKEGGLVDELDLAHIDGEKHYYETRMKQEHAHIICLRCGRVEEFFGGELQQLREQGDIACGGSFRRPRHAARGSVGAESLGSAVARGSRYASISGGTPHRQS